MRTLTHGLAVVIVLFGFSEAAVAADAHAHTEGPPTEAAPFGPPVDDQHVWFHAILDQFEGRLGNENNLRWDGEAWLGTDSDRLWLKSEGELTKSKLEEGQQEVYYSTPVSTYFDLQIGARYDLDSRSGRGWAAVGVEGLAPQFFHVSATAYASDEGHFAAKFGGSYDLLITQRLILQPEAEINLYSKNDPSRGIGSGLSDLDTGLRVRYEITRKFAPYVGLTYEKKFGRTAKYVSASGEKTDALRLAIGVRAWF
jgi:copper resistance protein B